MTLIGQIITEELTERGWTLEDLAAKSGIQPVRLREVIDGRGFRLTPVVALGLANAFGTSKELWVNLGRQSQEGRKP